MDLPPERKFSYEVDKPYAITIAPDNNKQFYRSPQRLTKFRTYMYELLLPLTCLYKFHIEISEPIGDISGQGPRLHAHGIITFRKKKEISEFLVMGLPLLLTNNLINISVINDKDIWNNYMNKQSLFKDNYRLITNTYNDLQA